MDIQAQKQVGLVFSGGGAKGSYQVGVWKALREFGIETMVSHVSGTSVGALNAVLFSMGALEQAMHIWDTISVEDILTIDRNTIRTWIEKIHSSHTKREALVRSARRFFGNNRSDGVFSRDRLESILDSEIDYSHIQNSAITTYATCFEKSSLSTKFSKLNGQSEETIRSILLASSAIPVLFESHRVEQQEYFDGGLSDNIPIQPLYDEGVRTFIIVNLSRSKVVETEAFPGSRFFEIAPQDDMGNLFTGTLNFTKRVLEESMAQGYADASQVLCNCKSLLENE